MCITLSLVPSLLSVHTLDSVSCLGSDNTVMCIAAPRMSDGEWGGTLQWGSGWLSAEHKALLHLEGRGEVRRAQLDLLTEAVTGAPWCSWSDGDTRMWDGSWHAQSWREQKTRHWDYPISWPGLRDPRSLTFRCLAFEVASAGPQLGSQTLFSWGQNPFCCCSSRRAAP